MAKADKSGQRSVVDEDMCDIILSRDRLSVAQANAVDLLLMGLTDQAVADAVGVTRQTVWRWRHHHHLLNAELNQRRARLWDTHVERLRLLLGRAIEVLARDLYSEDERLRHAAAVDVLKATGLYGSDLRPQGPTDAGEVEAEWVRDEYLRLLGKRESDAQALRIIALRDQLESKSLSSSADPGVRRQCCPDQAPKGELTTVEGPPVTIEDPRKAVFAAQYLALCRGVGLEPECEETATASPPTPVGSDTG